MTNLIDMTGRRFGKLVVLGRDNPARHKDNQAYWVCQCDCGEQIVAEGYKLRHGSPRDCGCESVKTVRRTKKCVRCGRLILHAKPATMYCEECARPHCIVCGTALPVGSEAKYCDTCRKAHKPWHLANSKEIPRGYHKSIEQCAWEARRLFELELTPKELSYGNFVLQGYADEDISETVGAFKPKKRPKPVWL